MVLVHLKEEKEVGWGAFNNTVSALRFFYRTTLAKDWRVDLIPFPHREKKLPVVLSPDEVQRFFAAIPCLRHRAMLVTAYAAGLRVSEVAHLQLEDIDSQRMVIRISQSKGHKDRYVMLSSRQARQTAPHRHLIPKLPLPDPPSATSDLPGIRRALAATRHLLEMYRRQLGDEKAHHKLRRLDKRLLNVAAELDRLTTAEK